MSERQEERNRNLEKVITYQQEEKQHENILVEKKGSFLKEKRKEKGET